MSRNVSPTEACLGGLGGLEACCAGGDADELHATADAEHIVALFIAADIEARRVQRVIGTRLVGFARLSRNLELARFLNAVAIDSTEECDLLVEMVISASVGALDFAGRGGSDLNHLNSSPIN